MLPIRPLATPAFRLAERQRHGPYRQRSSLLLHGPPEATRPPGWKPAACNRWACGALRSRAKRGPCDALPSVAMTMTGRACLAVRCDVHECPSQFVGQRSIRRSNVSPTSDDVESQNGQFVQFILQKKTASLSKLSVAIRQAQCPSIVNHLAGEKFAR